MGLFAIYFPERVKSILIAFQMIQLDISRDVQQQILSELEILYKVGLKKKLFFPGNVLSAVLLLKNPSQEYDV